MVGSAKKARGGMAVVAAALLTATLVACTGESQGPPTVSDSPDRGGTVKLLTKMNSFETLDPQAIYVTTDSNVSRLITRALTGFASDGAGDESGELVGDLATDTGTASNDSTVWTFTLREGVKWQSGEAVTCEDVRYGVLRSFDVNSDDPKVTGGPPYPTQWLKVPEDYQGPRVDGVDDVPGVTCVDEQTIEFELTESVPDFPRATAMTAFAPVPEAEDSWEDYGTEPVSNGPYRLIEYDPATEDEGGQAVFERNEHWDSDTDPIRQANPDKIVVEFGVDPDTAAQQIIADNPQYANAAMLGGVPEQFVSQVVNDSELENQLVTGSTDNVVFMTINTETVEELDCRKALVYAFNKRKFLDIYGGSEFGDFATTMIAPSDPAHREFDLYGQAGHPDGDLDKAEQLLESAGNCPDKLTIDIPDGDRSAQLAETIQDTYGRLGITVKTNEIPAEEFYGTLSSPGEISDLTMAGWAPDWPGGSGVLPPLFDGDLIKEGLTTNFALLDDPDINDAIDAAHAETDPEAAYEAWGEVDEMVAEQGAVVPIMFAKVLSLAGPKVRGAHLNPQWGEIDMATLGVASGS